MQEFLAENLIYWLTLALFIIGPCGMIFAKNLMKKLMGMNVMQVAVIIFFLALGQKHGGTVPVEVTGLGAAADYVNPLPHALMLTAIVVGLATTGVSLAILFLIQRNFNNLEEDEVLKILEDVDEEGGEGCGPGSDSNPASDMDGKGDSTTEGLVRSVEQ